MIPQNNNNNNKNIKCTNCGAVDKWKLHKDTYYENAVNIQCMNCLDIDSSFMVIDTGDN